MVQSKEASASPAGSAGTSEDLPGLPLPAIVQTALWVASPTRLLDFCQRRYGDPFQLKLSGMGPMVIMSDPQTLKRIFTADGEALLGGEGNSPLRPVLGEGSMLVLDGPKHLRHRRLMLPPFHGARMRLYGQTIRDIAVRASDRWQAGTVVAVHPSMQAISMQVILRVVFGLRDGPRLQEFLGVLRRYINYLSGSLIYLPFLQRDLGRYSPWGRFRRTVAEFRALLDDEIRARRAGADEEATDILSLLLRARDEDDRPLGDDELRDELITLLAAGHETTATALVWAVRHLLGNPAIERALAAELEAADPAADPDAVQRLPYLDAVCKETLRLYPVVPFLGRKVARPLEVNGRVFGKGAYLVPSIYLAHRREDIYPNAHEFDPQRFIDRRYTPDEYLPFGGGIRRCIGASFAQYEMKLVLATLLSRFRLELRGRRAIRPVRRNVTLYPKGGARVAVLERRW